MTPTLGQISFEAYIEFLPTPYINQHCIPETWEELSHSEQIAWQRAAVAVATFRASSVKSSDIFFDLAPHKASTDLAGALISNGEGGSL